MAETLLVPGYEAALVALGCTVGRIAVFLVAGVCARSKITLFLALIACALVLWWHKGERPKTATRAVAESSAAAGSSPSPGAARARV